MRVMGNIVSLTNHFLIAMPNLGDPNFSRTVTLICEHSGEGAMGLIINRPTDLRLNDILGQMNIDGSASEHLDLPIHLGGPVQNNRGFVLHEPLGQWESTLPVTDTLGVSTSRDILVALAENRGPNRCLVALGYATWSEWRPCALVVGLPLIHTGGVAGNRLHGRNLHMVAAARPEAEAARHPADISASTATTSAAIGVQPAGPAFGTCRSTSRATWCWSTTCCTPAAPSAPRSTNLRLRPPRVGAAGGAGGSRRPRTADRGDVVGTQIGSRSPPATSS
jgi:putative transcriptional regulator